MPFISAGDGDLKSVFITDVNLIDRFVGTRLFAWGYNYSGELGDNTTTNRSYPIQTIAFGNNWSFVSGGGINTAAIKTDGTLWIWGYNYYGQLGDNTRTSKSSPIQTITGGTNWKTVVCGLSNISTFTAAIKTDGTLWLWGRNSWGQLGDNTLTHRSSPVQVVGFASTWSSVSCGSDHAAAIKTDGTLWNWGQNFNGRLGDNTLIHKSSPIQTVALGTNWKQVSCGAYFTAAIKTDGTLWMWGQGNNGQLGTNTITHRSSPIQTVALGTNWNSVACGYYHTAAIKTDGTLWTWGLNTNGQLGDNTITSKSSPIQTITGGNNWSSVTCGSAHTAAIKTDGTLWNWGLNSFGQLGDNTTTNKSSPVQTLLRVNNWKRVSAGYYNTAAVTYGD